ncbi:MAG: hypothetical protein KC493_16735 [Bacteriovoracaceae bacterium]|nr:hypothetical protein [Bacteriovoracaceae bacterium]
MSLMKKFIGAIGPTTSREGQDNPFAPYFLRLEGDPNFPFLLAIRALEDLEGTVKSDRQLMEYLLEDIIFASIYATFYEHMFITMNENPKLYLELIDKFSEGGQDREMVIAAQTQLHLNYIMNGGTCSGCEACENHKDVEELVEHWNLGDMQFFIKLYLSMQTIQFSLEQLLYDVMPHRHDLLEFLTQETVLDYRQFLADFSDKKLEEI